MHALSILLSHKGISWTNHFLLIVLKMDHVIKIFFFLIRMYFLSVIKSRSFSIRKYHIVNFNRLQLFVSENSEYSPQKVSYAKSPDRNFI